ncbi:MAG: hypothetical protein LQ339_000614 [Xanthoria mediterranea]|nr:MAG: hypothetical protein LQ339_000614 [Xanthoria mediterranea]
MAYIETPRTDAGNSTIANGYDLDDISAENTFVSPSKQERDRDVVSQLLQNGRRPNINTPRSRVPFRDRGNLQTAPVRGEFTPLLASAAKKNPQQNGKRNAAPETPAFLRNGYKGSNTPVLPSATPGAYSENTEGSLGAIDEETPVPQMASSSAQATPLAPLAERDGEAVLTDQGNAMALREQENIINKIDKENFGLKLKIHFLEESLQKSGPGLHAAALKENTELKVDRVTMQKELARARRTLDKTEREVEEFRDRLQKFHDQMKQKHADKKLLEELELLREEVATKDSNIRDLHHELDRKVDKDAEIERLKSDLEEVAIDVREKDRLLEDQEEELETFKEKAKRGTYELAEALRTIKSGEQRIQELEEDQRTSADYSVQLHDVRSKMDDGRRHIHELEEELEQAENRKKAAQEETEEAQQAKIKAEEDLDELRDEISDKSFSTKGLNRQLEEKIQKLQIELDDLQKQGTELEREADQRESHLRGENENLRQKLDTIDKKCASLTTQLQEATNSLQRKSEEKDLLHSRHDALTTESHSLQRDLTRTQAKVKELEASLDAERSHALENDRQLREEADNENRQLADELNRLQREWEDKNCQEAAEKDLWESQRRGLESERDRASDQAAGLQRTIDKLQEAEGTLSGREQKLQEALQSEKQRHESQEASLKRDLEELDASMKAKRKQLADTKAELSSTNEQLRVSRRNEATLEETVQALEDEVNVLQEGLDEEAARSKDESMTARQDVESLRRQLQATKQELTRAETKLADVRAELETYQGDLQVGKGSQDQLNSRLLKTESDLKQVKAERQSLQDKLASHNLEMHKLRSLLKGAEDERDEVMAQLKQADAQVDKVSKHDEEKSDLKRSKVRLESEVARLREDCDALLDKNEAVERELDEEVQRASNEESRLNGEIAEVKRKANTASDGKERELNTARQRIQRLESQIQEFADRATHSQDDSRAHVELSILQKDLSAARKRETDFVQRESAQREAVRELKSKVTRLERQVHEAEVGKLALDSPRSSVGGSGRKTEIAELRSQLSNAHQQLKDLRSKSRDTEKELRRKLGEAEQEARSQMVASEQEHEQLEQEISTLRHEQESEQSRLGTAESTISRLRGRIHKLESSLREARSNTGGDRTMADERKDLHEMLKDAKLEAEDLQLQIATRESNLQAAATREQELRTHLQRVRDERSHQQKRSSALVTELDQLQSRYERAVENLGRHQKQWEAERKAMNSRVRFPNTSISENKSDDGEAVKGLQLVVAEKEKKHASEIHGMATQIQWMRWNLEREADFRHCLKFEKSYLTTQIKMYEACNQLDLAMMKKKFGIDAEKDYAHLEPVRKPHLRTFAFMIVFLVRAARYAREWNEQKKVKKRLNEALERARRGQLMKRIEAAGRG